MQHLQKIIIELESTDQDSELELTYDAAQQFAEHLRYVLPRYFNHGVCHVSYVTDSPYAADDSQSHCDCLPTPNCIACPDYLICPAFLRKDYHRKKDNPYQGCL